VAGVALDAPWSVVACGRLTVPCSKWGDGQIHAWSPAEETRDVASRGSHQKVVLRVGKSGEHGLDAELASA
jgi:hypothetical protein